ncbi:MAG: SMC-Scp complex subunit ScpB [Acidimicrobiales bacterium]|nr:SMC-Scp complex subunit ScpB [Acidimicrobiales bacterium]
MTDDGLNLPAEPGPGPGPGSGSEPAPDPALGPAPGDQDLDPEEPSTTADASSADMVGGEHPQPRAQVRDDARRAIEAIVLVSEQPIDVNLLAQLLELRPSIIEELCRELAAEYDAAGRGFQLARVAGGWRFQSHPDQAPYVERFVLAGQTAKLSAAALETLAIVAYKQPISRAQVASIRGVSVDGVMRTLQQRGYIAEVSRDPGPGQASMFGTTRALLEKLGVDSLNDLPALGDFVPAADVVEQLERGLRPDGPTLPERLSELEHTNSRRDLASKSPNGTLDRDLAEMDLAEARRAGGPGDDEGFEPGVVEALGDGDEGSEVVSVRDDDVRPAVWGLPDVDRDRAGDDDVDRDRVGSHDGDPRRADGRGAVVDPHGDPDVDPGHPDDPGAPDADGYG